VTRIIAGRARGRRLQTLRGDLTRPTADRVREALFSSLEAALGSLHGLSFLDLYAGSGAVGLEAWSRGAAVVVLVERNPRAATLVRANATGLGAAGVRVVAASVRGALGQPPASAYDVVFLDPPYAAPMTQLRGDLAALLERGWLRDGATVVVEHSTRAEPVDWPPGLVPERTRTYGETALSYATARSSPAHEAPGTVSTADPSPAVEER
jgi:16S rRNA (guanine966-N2)-methyltransferase